MPRKLPLLTAENRAFWQGGERGELLVYRCRSCETWFHPPAPICPRCNAVEVGPEPVSGRGTVASFTINVQAWTPELAAPYVVAIVELIEQSGLRFVTNIVGCAPDQVTIDMPVRVTFVPCDDVWLPLFKKDA